MKPRHTETLQVGTLVCVTWRGTPYSGVIAQTNWTLNSAHEYVVKVDAPRLSVLPQFIPIEDNAVSRKAGTEIYVFGKSGLPELPPDEEKEDESTKDSPLGGRDLVGGGFIVPMMQHRQQQFELQALRRADFVCRWQPPLDEIKSRFDVIKTRLRMLVDEAQRFVGNSRIPKVSLNDLDELMELRFSDFPDNIVITFKMELVTNPGHLLPGCGNRWNSNSYQYLIEAHARYNVKWHSRRIERSFYCGTDWKAALEAVKEACCFVHDSSFMRFPD